jgi:pimeloyl-ACP methyl ester carboxylesterase
MEMHHRKSEEVIIRVHGDILLHGWLVRNSEAEKSPLVIYYGGNAEEVSEMISLLSHIDGYSVLLMNYRGYGNSEGSPSETVLKSDAEQIFDAITSREDIDGENIVLMGKSIGSGIAVHIADKKPVKAVILITPYDSIVNVAKRNFRVFPVDLIMRNRFDSASMAPGIRTPMLALIAERDTVIPPVHAHNLIEQWGGRTVSVIIDGAGHNDIIYNSLLWESIGQFLNDFE